jgi:hypothetical protein
MLAAWLAGTRFLAKLARDHSLSMLVSTEGFQHKFDSVMANASFTSISRQHLIRGEEEKSPPLNLRM